MTVKKPAKARKSPAKPEPLTVVYRPTESIVPDPQNARTHSPAQVEQICASIREFGWTNPILLRPNGMAGAGYARLMAAKVLGMAEVPTITLSGLTDAQWRAYALADNKLALNAGWDLEILSAEITDLQVSGFDLDLLGFSDLELGEIGIPGFTPEERVERAEETPPLSANPTIKRGELWLLDGHRILCGDSTEKGDVERLMGGQKAHMIFTDPPYGVDYTGGMKKRERLAADHVGTDIYSAALPHLNFAADDKAPLYLWYADGHAAAAAGYAITAQIIWAKNHAQFMTAAHYKGKHEPCYYAHRRGKTARWHGPNNEVTLWEYDRSPTNDYHPTQKPVAIAQRAIKNSSEPGQIVLDLFLGGGTTVIGAEMEGRLGFGMELSPAYVEVEILRWQKFTGKVARREDGKTLEELKNVRRRKA